MMICVHVFSVVVGIIWVFHMNIQSPIEWKITKLNNQWWILILKTMGLSHYEKACMGGVGECDVWHEWMYAGIRIDDMEENV